MKKLALLLVIAASFSTMVVLAVYRPKQPTPEAHQRRTERPWLTREAAEELAGPNGELGPLFADVTLGGSAPSAETRARIAEFGRANNVEIKFEVHDDELRAIRMSVTFGGCCGYEGADSLATHFHRPRMYSHYRPDWVDDWSVALDNGTNIRGRVRVNRVEIRWEPVATLPEVLATADSIVGKPRAEVKKAHAERWIEIEHGHSYTLEVPYPFRRADYGEYVVPLPAPEANLQIEGEHGRVDDVAFTLRDGDIDVVKAAMREHWGRPRIAGSTWTWKKSDRVITADLDAYSSTVKIHAL